MAGPGSGRPTAGRPVASNGEAEVLSALSFASENGIAVVPYGGGTSVVGGVSASNGPFRSVVTLDLSGMDRVGEIDTGTLVDGKISLTIAEDVYSMPADTYVAPQLSGWAPPNNNPVAPVFFNAYELDFRSLYKMAGSAIAWVEQQA